MRSGEYIVELCRFAYMCVSVHVLVCNYANCGRHIYPLHRVPIVDT